MCRICHMTSWQQALSFQANRKKLDEQGDLFRETGTDDGDDVTVDNLAAPLCREGD
jgi:hypothetical protein